MSKKQPTACPVRKTSIGGQALMEGIMMRGPKTTAMAVRNPRGEIVLETFSTESKKRPAICRWPVIRGVFGFIDSMSIGYKCLMRSAEISGLEEIEAEMEREKAEKKAAKAAAKKAAKAAKKGGSAPVEDTPHTTPDNTADSDTALVEFKNVDLETLPQEFDLYYKSVASGEMKILSLRVIDENGTVEKVVPPAPEEKPTE
jgi:hypothetical protein